jgi:hypothetical protein
MYTFNILVGWADKLLLPAFFTSFGAVLSLFVSEWKEHRQAKKRKETFLRAVGMELDALTEQFESTRTEIEDSLARLESSGNGPHLVGTVRNIVFTSQLGKLRDVDDPLIMAVIKLYSDLSSVEKMLSAANETSKMYVETTSDVQKTVARSRLKSALRVMKEQLESYLKRIQTTRSKLPAAPRLT